LEVVISTDLLVPNFTQQH